MQGERIFLCPDIDLAAAKKARNNPLVYKWCRQFKLLSDFDQERWAEQISCDPTIEMFAICKHEGLQPQVGVCGFTSIDRHNRSAEFSLYISAEYQKNGYAREAMGLLLDHGFYDFGFHRIWGEVFDGNPSLDLFKKLGFEINGILRHSYFREGRFINSTMIDLLDHEWRRRN